MATLPARRWLRILRLAGKAATRRHPVTSTLGLAGANARAHGACSSIRSRSPTVRGRVRRHRRASSRGAAGSVQALCARQSQRSSSLHQGSAVVGASRQRAAPRSQFVGAPRMEGLISFAVAVHAAREGCNVSVGKPVQVQLWARPNRSFNRRRRGRLPCPRGAVCLSCTARARQPTASPRLPLR